MAKFQKCRFEKSTVVLDGNEYIDTAFVECRVVITRGNFSLQGCSFDRCNFEFGGEAENIKNLVLGLVQQKIPTSPPETQHNPPEAKQSPSSAEETDNG